MEAPYRRRRRVKKLAFSEPTPDGRPSIVCKKMEAPTGIEPVYAVLQTAA